MRAPRIFAIGMLAAGLAGCGGSPPSARSRPSWIMVSPNVQVSVDNAHLAHGEVLVAADPVNPDHLIACSGIWAWPARSSPHFGMRDVAYVTFDGGTSWQGTSISHVGAASDLDPACAIGVNGIAYFAGAALSDSEPGRDWLTRSTDGGLRWSKPILFPFADRDFLAVDEFRSSYRGRLYDTGLGSGHEGGSKAPRFVELRSTDSGATLLPPVAIFNEPPAQPSQGGAEYYSGPLTVLRNGDVVAVAYAMPLSSPASALSKQRKRIVSFLSTDGGATFSGPNVVAERLSNPRGDFRYKQEGQSVIPVIASDDSTGPFSGRIYVAWQDFTKHTYGAFTPFEPEGAIMIAHSDDGGKMWSTPVEVDDAPAWPERRYPEVFAPAIAVNNEGVVAVTWSDARTLPDGVGGVLRMAVSSDGGDTFSPSFPVSSAPSLLFPDSDSLTLTTGAGYGLTDVTNLVTDVRFHVYGQDTQGLTADAAGKFHSVWVDNRTGTAQLWTATVTVNKRAVRHGDPSLSNLMDVSKSVDLDVFDAAYARHTHDVTASVALVNTSKRPIAGPIRVRITGLTSQFGRPEMQGSNNVAGSGAILTFMPSTGSALAPDGTSKRLHLIFHLPDVHAATPHDVVIDWINYVTISYRAYARASEKH